MCKGVTRVGRHMCKRIICVRRSHVQEDHTYGGSHVYGGHMCNRVTSTGVRRVEDHV